MPRAIMPRQSAPSPITWGLMPTEQHYQEQSGGGDGGQGDFQPINSQEEFDRRIQARIAREKDKYAEVQQKLTDANAELATLRDAQSTLDSTQSQLTTITSERDEAQRELAESKQTILRMQVAHAKGVPAHRIAGGTREELEADADKLLNEFQDRAPQGGAHIPESGTGGEQPTGGSLQSGRERARARHAKAEANH